MINEEDYLKLVEKIRPIAPEIPKQPYKCSDGKIYYDLLEAETHEAYIVMLQGTGYPFYIPEKQ